MRCLLKYILVLLCVPYSLSAQVVMSEIMYDLKEGSDDGREWFEVKNIGTLPIDLSVWKFFEANAHHSITHYEGPTEIPVQGFAVVADEPDKFLADWPDFKGILFDSSWSSFSNSGEILAMKNGDAVIDQVSYVSEWGGSGDGNSVQKKENSWRGESPTPGTDASGNSGVIPEPVPLENLVEEPVLDAPVVNPVVSKWKIDPQIYAFAGDDLVATAGVPISLKALSYGLEKKPLEADRYLWTLGDGGIREGKIISHTYKIPGEYIAFLSISAGEYSATDRLKVTVIPSELAVSNASEGIEGSIEIVNASRYESDLSGWILRSGGLSFVFPENTFIFARKKISFPAEVTKIFAFGLSVDLLYPNGRVAHSFDHKKTVVPEIKKTVSVPVPEAKKIVVESVEKKQETVEPYQLASAVSLAEVEESFEEHKNFTVKDASFFIFGGVLVVAVAAYLLLAKGESDEITILE